MQDPVGMEIVNSVQYLEEQRLHHTLGHLHRRPPATFYSTVELNYVLGGRGGREREGGGGGERKEAEGREREGGGERGGRGRAGEREEDVGRGRGRKRERERR